MSDETKPIEPLIVNEIPGTAVEEDPTLTLTLRRTKGYARKILNNMPVADLVALVNQQAQLVILALGEHSLKLIEELDAEPDQGRRAALHEQIEKTIARGSDVARKKNELISAIGYDPQAIGVDAEGKPIANATKTRIGKDQFESMFGSLNPFATVADAEFEKAKKVVTALLTPEQKAKLDSAITEAVGDATGNLRRVDDPDKLN